MCLNDIRSEYCGFAKVTPFISLLPFEKDVPIRKTSSLFWESLNVIPPLLSAAYSPLPASLFIVPLKVKFPFESLLRTVLPALFLIFIAPLFTVSPVESITVEPLLIVPPSIVLPLNVPDVIFEAF